MCDCGSGIIAADAGDRKAARTARCKTFECPICGPRRAAELRAKLYEARPNRFFTLTIRHLETRTLSEEVELLKGCWRRFRLWWNRTYPQKQIECCSIWELKGERHAHMHVLARCGFVPVNVLKAFFQKEIGSFKQDVRKIYDLKEVGRYITKYVTKDLVKLPHTHRYAPTHGFFKPSEPPPRDPFFDHMEWRFERQTLAQFAHYWVSRAWRIDLDMKHDLCTVRPP